jgi:hypothetical protein
VSTLVNDPFADSKTFCIMDQVGGVVLHALNNNVFSKWKQILCDTFTRLLERGQGKSGKGTFLTRMAINTLHNSLNVAFSSQLLDTIYRNIRVIERTVWQNVVLCILTSLHNVVPTLLNRWHIDYFIW